MKRNTPHSALAENSTSQASVVATGVNTNEQNVLNATVNWKKNSPKFLTTSSPTFFQLLADLFSCTLGFAIFWWFKVSSAPPVTSIVTQTELFATLALVNVMYWVVVFWLGGLYKNWYIRSPFDEFFSVIKSVLFGGGVVFFLLLLDTAGVRMKVFLFLALIITSVCVGRFIVRKIQKRLRINKVITLPSLYVGKTDMIQSLSKIVQNEPSWGFDVQGSILFSKEDAANWNMSVPILGFISELEQMLDSLQPSVLLVALTANDHDVMLHIATLASDRNISVKIVPDLYEVVSGQAKALQIYGSPLIEVNPELLKPWEEALKRLSDIVFSIAVLVLGLPIWILLGICIKLESRGPIFYTQPRIGRNGITFKIFKFRSMVQDSEKHGQQWTVVGDPRVTKFGRFIRKTHLDEIPQFWNVLKGDMSIVGPRPEQPKFVEKYAEIFPYYNRRHKVRPGITGWWQVKYKEHQENAEEIKDRLKYDFYYIENMSIKLDLEIYVRTVFVMLKGHGQT